MRVARILALYFLGFLPLFGLLAFTEGAVRGEWAFSSHDFTYQMGAYIAFWGGWLLVSSALVVPLIALTLAWVERRLVPHYATLMGLLLGPLAVFVGAGAVEACSALISGTALLPSMLLVYPIALLLAGAAFGFAVASLDIRDLKGSSPAAA
jgi:hypothetical protein